MGIHLNDLDLGESELQILKQILKINDEKLPIASVSSLLKNHLNDKFTEGQVELGFFYE